MADKKVLMFECDYQEGAHPAVIERLAETNLEQEPGYGFDRFSESAREKIRKACDAPDADVFFLAGGSQTNATMIDALLKQYEGVISSSEGHIATNEAGAVEFSGHKVIEVPSHGGKVEADDVAATVESYNAKTNRDHLVMPGMVYISQPTECGTLYSKAELTELRRVCRKYGLPLYADGARLAYALACPENDVTLADLASLTDAFYIGGTKCGALLGEALVIPQHDLVPHMFTIIKQHGALLAKGRAAGVQFDALFTDDLYVRIAAHAIEEAARIRGALQEKGYEFALENPTNQVFVVLDGDTRDRLARDVVLEPWEDLPDGRHVMRIATSWATTHEDVDRLIALL